jgi:hypothetical protein
MKDIKDMNLAEAITALRDVDVITRGYQCNYDAIEELADRIHDLTRWIPVSERMPTEADVDEHGEVLAWSPDPHITYTASCIPLSHHFTRWQRITPPEGV